MDYNLLVNPLPENIEIDGVEYRLNTSTDRAIDCIERLSDKSLSDQVKENYIIRKLLGNKQFEGDTKTRILAKLIAYLSSAPTPEYEPSGLPRSKEPLIYWATDSPSIAASFRQAYGISLTELKAMHFWEFMALLYSLPSDTRMGYLMQTRTSVIDAKESLEEKKVHEAQKKSAKPKDKRSKEEKEADAIKMLASSL